MDTAIELSFGPGTFRFWLPLPRVIEIERNCGTSRIGDMPACPKSLFQIYDQMSGGLGLSGDTAVYLGGGAAIVNDVREVIRCALLGGNYGYVAGQEIEIGPEKAKEIVEEYVFPARPLVEGVHVAWAILHKAITGIDLKKKADEEKGDQSLSEKVN